MPDPLFDVYVVGSVDPTSAGQDHLAHALSVRHGVPPATVAKAVAEKNLRAGAGLPRPQAEDLARQLQLLGAVTSLRPAIAGGPTRIGPPPMGAAAEAGRPGFGSGLPLPGAPTTLRSLAPLGSLTPLGAAPPDRAGAYDAFSMSGSPSLAPAGASLADSFSASPPSARGGRSGAAAPPPAAMVGRDPFAGPDDQPESTPVQIRKNRFGPEDMAAEQGLDLDLGGSSTEAMPARSLPGASGMNQDRLVATSSSSGMKIEGDSGNPNSVRCPKHGLFYDKKKSSGCRKCMEPARIHAATIESRVVGGRVGGLKDNPVKRAFLGLTLALVIGLLPAAYSALRIGAGEVARLRGEQEELSHKVGTEDNLRRFDQIDIDVTDARDKSIRNTLIIWVAISGLALAGWYRIT